MRTILFMALLFFSCNNIPDDPENTLTRITNDDLRVGFSDNPPWTVRTSDGATGIEAEIIKVFAEKYNARIIWIYGTEQKLFEKLENFDLDIVIAGITDKTPWKKKKIGLTRPFYTEAGKKHVMAVKQGENRFQMALEHYLFSLRNQNKVIVK